MDAHRTVTGTLIAATTTTTYNYDDNRNRQEFENQICFNDFRGQSYGARLLPSRKREALTEPTKSIWGATNDRSPAGIVSGIACAFPAESTALYQRRQGADRDQGF